MWKKVIGIILIVISSFSLFFGLVFGGSFGALGSAFGFTKQIQSNYFEEDESRTVYGYVDDVLDDTSYIVYEVDGVPYIGSITMTSTAHPPGTSVEVCYLIDDPSVFTVPEISDEVFGTLQTIFGGVGIIFAIVFGVFGVIGIVVGILLIKSYNKLKKQM